MATEAYLYGRQKYSRPQAILFSNNPGSVIIQSDEAAGVEEKIYIPDGYEVNSKYPSDATADEIDQFLILSDHNRSPINISYDRIENRQRTVNGVMRSRHISDKLKISTSWSLLPSRAFSLNPSFDQASGSPVSKSNDISFTVDQGAGGNDLLDWYDTHTGPFWVFLGYDKLTGINSGDVAYRNFSQYTHIVQMYISKFDYSIEKRSGSLYDMWNVSIDLEEV